MKASIFLIIQIARLCHEANREYCISIGDFSQVPWEQAPFWQKLSAVKGVLYHLYFYPAFNPQASHESWLMEKTNDGWKYGPKKDADKKEHPCFVPYEQLPIEQQLKYHMFINIIHAVVKSLGAIRIEANGDPEKRGNRIVCDVEPSEELIAQLKKMEEEAPVDVEKQLEEFKSEMIKAQNELLEAKAEFESQLNEKNEEIERLFNKLNDGVLDNNLGKVSPDVPTLQGQPHNTGGTKAPEKGTQAPKEKTKS